MDGVFVEDHSVTNDYSLEVRGVLMADTLTVERHQVNAGRFDVRERIDK